MNNHVLTVYTDRVQREVKVQYSTSISVYKHDSIVLDTGLRSRNTVPRTHTHTHTHNTHTHTYTHTHTHNTHTFRDSTSVLYTTYWGENACV